MQFGKIATRLIFYAENDRSEEELQHIKDFMDWCKGLNYKIPEDKTELMRFLYGKKFVFQKAYDAANIRTNF